ncbi:MAG: DUF3014 domain-containing protein [Vicinamibacterales bacterium]
MNEDPADFDLREPGVEEPPAPPTVTAVRRSPILLGAALLLIVVLAGAYFYLRAPTRPPATTARIEQPQSQRPAEADQSIPLPPLDESDPLVRELVSRLSSHPTVLSWLATDGLIVNFALVTHRIADGRSPAKELGFLGPIAPFRPRTSRDDLFIDPSSYRRYDKYAQAVSALDARGAARLYATLKPRLLDAQRRINPSGGEFDPVLERAIVQLLQVPVLHGEVELVPKGIGYGFADPKLEALSASQKQLLRMGPQNVQAIQQKLRDIADYLAIPASKLPR